MELREQLAQYREQVNTKISLHNTVLFFFFIGCSAIKDPYVFLRLSVRPIETSSLILASSLWFSSFCVAQPTTTQK